MQEDSKKWLLLAFILLALAGLVFLSNSGGPAQVQATPTPATSPLPERGGGSEIVFTTPEPGSAVSTNKVTILLNDFSPRAIRVGLGDTVTWENQDGRIHGVRSRANVPENFSSGSIGGRQTFSFKFTKPGTYEYYDDLTGSSTGVVYVG